MPQRCIWGPSRAESCPPGGRAHPLTSSTRECDWTQCHCRCNHVKTGSARGRASSKAGDGRGDFGRRQGHTLGEHHATTEGDGGQRGHTPGPSRTAGSQRRPGASRGRLALRTARSFRYLALSRLCLSVTTAPPAWRRPPVLHPSPPPHARDLAAAPCPSPVPGAPARPCLCVPAGPFLLLKCLFPTSCAEILPSSKPK